MVFKYVPILKNSKNQILITGNIEKKGESMLSEDYTQELSSNPIAAIETRVKALKQ